MSDLRNAAQQALRAFTGLLTFNPTYDDYENGRVAVDALRTSLAQPEPAGKEDMKVYAAIADKYNKPYIAPSTSTESEFVPAQPEPVEVRQGREYMQEKGLLQGFWNEYPTTATEPMTVEDTLAEAGFRRNQKPLTEEEIYKLFGWYAVPFIRAVEKAHGIE